MDNRGYQHYKQNSLDTMTDGELLLMLYDGLVKKLVQTEILMQQQNYTESDKLVDKCIDIVHYLSDTLNSSYEISHSLRRLYEYFCYELVRVKFGHNITELERVKKMVVELRDTFKQADKNVTIENAGQSLNNTAGAVND